MIVLQVLKKIILREQACNLVSQKYLDVGDLEYGS